jgi:hypothetical protein
MEQVGKGREGVEGDGVHTPIGLGLLLGAGLTQMGLGGLVPDGLGKKDRGRTLVTALAKHL